MKYDIVVMGGGTSAGFLLSFLSDMAVERGLRILVLEKTKGPFRKVYCSGNGRCNFSNTGIAGSSYYSMSASEAWRKKAFEAVSRLNLKQYFHEKGIPSRSDEFGRLMPYTNSAKTIGDFFERQLRSSGVTLLTRAEVVSVARVENGYAVRYRNNDGAVIVRTDTAVYACGGSAYQQPGTDGSGFDVLRALGHTITKQAAGIVPLETRETAFHELAGLKMECGITVGDFSRKGEILFTKYGVSGPNVLYASNEVSLRLLAGPVEMAVDFLPEETFTPEYFRSICTGAGEKTVTAVFGGVLSAEFLRAFIAHNGIPERISPQDVERVFLKLKASRFTVTRTRPLQEAQVSLGGVSADEIDPESFESRLHRDLFIMGEAIDYTGGSGGYNIHWCAATARGAADRICRLRRGAAGER